MSTAVREGSQTGVVGLSSQLVYAHGDFFSGLLDG